MYWDSYILAQTPRKTVGLTHIGQGVFAQRRNVLCDTLSRPAASLADNIAFFHAEYKDRMKEISIILDRYIPNTAQMRTELKITSLPL